MSGKTIHFLRTPYGKLILALGFMVLSWLFLLLHFSSDMKNLLPSAESVEKMQEEVRREKKEFETQDAKKRAADALKKQYDARLNEFWQEEKDGDVELGLRQLVEDAARTKDVKLDSLGSVRTSKINNELYFAELDVTLTGELSLIATFLAAVKETTPVVYWKRADIRPWMMRGGQNQRNNQPQPKSTVNNQPARTTNTAAPQTETTAGLRFSGTIRVICYAEKEDEE